MTRQEKARWLAEIYAAVTDGKALQLKNAGQWHDEFIGGPNLDSNPNNWRIKTEPMEYLTVVSDKDYSEKQRIDMNSCEYSMSLKVTLHYLNPPTDHPERMQREVMQSEIDAKVGAWLSDTKNQQNLMNMILGAAMQFSDSDIDRVAYAICAACGENPEYRGDCRGND